MPATLVSLVQAKAHLRITVTTDDTDIQLKLDQAEAIILTYLKNPVIAIESVTAGAAGIVRTTTPHGLTNGATYLIADTITTPTINGARVITVTGPYTFTVPVAVTSGQAAEVGTLSTVTWTTGTVPGNITAAILLLLGNLYELRGDDQTLSEGTWTAIERLLVGLRDPALA